MQIRGNKIWVTPGEINDVLIYAMQLDIDEAYRWAWGVSSRIPTDAYDHINEEIIDIPHTEVTLGYLAAAAHFEGTFIPYEEPIRSRRAPNTLAPGLNIA